MKNEESTDMFLVKDGYVMDPKSGKEGKRDILIQGEKIRGIAEYIPVPDEGCQLIKADGLIVAPGLVDVHVHFRDPGFTEKEDIFTGARAAAKGGFTSVVMMANTNPQIDNTDTLEYVLKKGSQTGIHIFSCANVTKKMQGKELTDFNLLRSRGAAGFTDDGVPILDEALAREAMTRAAKLKVPISFHEEDPQYIGNNGINRGKASDYYGIEGSDRAAEITMIERDLKIALETGAIVDIQHISAKESVELVRQAKRKGAKVHAEATPHHFTLTEEAVIKYGSLAKMNPPLREETDRLAIIEGLTDGTIDLIATDHAPHTREEKERPINKAPSGIIGLETALALGITELVDKGYLSMMELLEKMTINPAAMYHLDAGYLAEGGPADLVLIDRRARVTAGDYVSKASNTPFTGWELTGRIVRTICAGKTVYTA